MVVLGIKKIMNRSSACWLLMACNKPKSSIGDTFYVGDRNVRLLRTTCGLQTAQISMLWITRSGLSCSVVSSRDKIYSTDELKRRLIDVWCSLEQSIFIARQHTDARYWYSKFVYLSVCPSGWPFVRFWYWMKTAQRIVIIFPPYGSPIILVLSGSNIFTKFDGFTPTLLGR